MGLTDSLGKKERWLTTILCGLVYAVTRKEAHPLPRVDDTLDTLAGTKWFSTLDLISGY